MKNIIILGPGRTGSSILSGIISRGGYYINQHSIQSRKAYPDGDYENPELVELNKRLYHKSGHKWDRLEPGQKIDLELMDAYARSDELEDFKSFMNQCNRHQPWLWKDPRLVFTMHFWKHLIDIDNIKFITISRDPYLIFRSHTKYQISFTKKEIYNRYYYELETMNDFIAKNNIHPLNVDYSEFWNKTMLLDKLNGFLEFSLVEEDYDAIIRNDIKKPKETPLQFSLRYAFGAAKLHFARLIK